MTVRERYREMNSIADENCKLVMSFIAISIQALMQTLRDFISLPNLIDDTFVYSFARMPRLRKFFDIIIQPEVGMLFAFCLSTIMCLQLKKNEPGASIFLYLFTGVGA